MRRVLAKSALGVAQASSFVILLGYLVTRSQLVVVPAFIAVAYLLTVKCEHCGTSFTDSRMNQRFRLLRFWDVSIIDCCPVCQHGMVAP
jgi:hypothetical protein